MKTSNVYSHIEKSISGSYRLFVNDTLIYEDPACEDLNGTYAEAKAFFENYEKENFQYVVVWDGTYADSIPEFVTNDLNEARKVWHMTVQFNANKRVSKFKWSKYVTSQNDLALRKYYRLKLYLRIANSPCSDLEEFEIRSSANFYFE